MKARLFVAILIAASTALLLVPVDPPEAAAALSGWSTPQRITGPSARAHLSYGLISDQAGAAHMFWTQTDGRGAAIDYSRWDGSSWSPAVDVLLSPLANAPVFLDAVIDPQGIIHLIFFAGRNQEDGHIYYAQAPAWEAGSARSWIKPIEVVWGATSSGSIAVTPDGTLRVLYGQLAEPLVYATFSKDGGKTWAVPDMISGDCVSGALVPTVKTATDGIGRVHAVWAAHNEKNFGEIVCYSRLLPSQDSWSQTRMVDRRSAGVYGVGEVSVMAVGKDEIHVGWMGGIGPPGRVHQWTTDGGATWTSPQQITDLAGQNGMALPMAVDSAGHLHSITHGRYMQPGEIHGMFYLPWEGDLWGPRSPIVEGRIEELFDPQNPRLVVVGGNQLLAVYGNDPPRGIWYSVAKVDASKSDPKPYTTVVARSSAVRTAIASTPTPVPTALPTATPAPALKNSGETSASPIAPQVNPIVAGVLSAMLIVTGAAARGLWRIYSTR